jgi:hypothetical protein
VRDVENVTAHAAGKRRFDEADTDHDGWLSKDELLTMRQNRRGGAGGQGRRAGSGGGS